MLWHDKTLVIGDKVLHIKVFTFPDWYRNLPPYDLAWEADELSLYETLKRELINTHIKDAWAARSNEQSKAQGEIVLIKEAEEERIIDDEPGLIPVIQLWKLPSLEKSMFISFMLFLECPLIQKPIDVPSNLSEETLKKWQELTSQHPKYPQTNLEQYWQDFFTVADRLGFELLPRVVALSSVIFQVPNPGRLSRSDIDEFEEINRKHFHFTYSRQSDNPEISELVEREQTLNARLEKHIIVAGCYEDHIP